MAEVLVVHGPNLNLLGKRETDIYGSDSLDDINKGLLDLAKQNNIALDIFQSNSEEQIVAKIQAAVKDVKFIIINAAAFTHTSISIRDALKFAEIPFIEVHISNVFAREEFRHKSFLNDIATGVICGLGSRGYSYALQHSIHLLSAK